ncbi:MAG: hypothetical protein QNJ54_16915 [Prochloraceae cyanobacterium]|nr:hypothetical protein [Prochloraceae cyanobacterium]
MARKKINIGRDQVNVGRDYIGHDQNIINQPETVNIIQGQDTRTSDPKVLLRQAMKLLDGKSYQQSIDLLNTAIEADPSMAEAYYYLALAKLRGQRPKFLKCSEIEVIDQLLCTAAIMGDTDETVQWFRALLRDDYYGGNHMNCPPPSVEDILASIHPEATDTNKLRSLLKKMPMPDNQLYAWLVEQIF